MPAREHYLVDLPRRLPVNVALADGESFPSWIERLSASLAMPVINLLWEFGMTHSGAEGVPFYGVRMRPDQLAHAAAATGESAAHIASSLLDSYVDELPTLSNLAQTGSSRGGGVAVGTWASLRGSRYCPDCVRADSVWQLRWRLSWSLACVEHDRLLIDRCCACGRLPGKGGRRPLPNFRKLVARPGRCNNPALSSNSGDPRCGALLAEHPTVVRPSADEVLAQRTLDLVRTEGEGVLWGRTLPSRSWFEALRNLVALINALAQPDDLCVSGEALRAFTAWTGERDRSRMRGESAASITGPPRSLGLASAAVPPAVRAMTADTGADALDSLVHRAAARGRTRWRALPTRLAIGQLVAEGWKDATRPMVGFSIKASIGRRPDGYGFDARHIPQLLPLTAYEHLAPLLPGTSPLVGRAFSSVALARVAEGCSWSSAAARLGIDPQRAKRLVDAVRPRVESDVLWCEFQRLAEAWPSHGLTDFAQRRDALREVTEIDPDAFRAMRLATGIGPGWARACRRNSAAWVWEHVAGGDARTSPALLAAEACGTSRSSVREVYRRFCLWAPSELQKLLTEWALDAFYRYPATAGHNELGVSA